MLNIFENVYAHVIYDEVQNLVEFYYKSEALSGKLTDADYRKSMQAYGAAVEKYKPKKLLVNTLNSAYVISPEMQEWTAKEVTPLTVCLEQLAFIVPKSIFSQVSLEQMLEEKGIGDVYSGIRYFDTLQEAENWLHIVSRFQD
jgi:hypothetical protein